MEIHSFLASHIRANYKTLLLLGTASLTVYLIKKYMDKKKQSRTAKKGKKKIKEFPTIEEIQRFIEDLPFDAVNTDKAITLKDLLGELSEFSEDEEWKELIASVHTMYEDNEVKLPEDEETGSIMSIYEDPNIITLHNVHPKEEHIDKTQSDSGCKDNGDNETTINLSQEKVDDDTTISPIASEQGQMEEQEPKDFEVLFKSTDDEETTEIKKADDLSLVF